MNILTQVRLASSKELIIRTYELRDYSAVQNNLKEAGMFDEIIDCEKSLRLMSEQNPESILVATVDDEIVGSLFLPIFGFRAFILRFNVKKQFRGKGVDKKLLGTAKTILRHKKIPICILFYRADNTHLENYYERGGWVKDRGGYLDQMMSMKLSV